MTVEQLQDIFQMQLPFFIDGKYWNGKPNKWSNLPTYRLNFTQRFGMNLLDYSQFGLDGHNGIDIGFIKRTPITAPCRMWVSWANNDSGYGKYIFGETVEIKSMGESVKIELVFGHFDEVTAKSYKWYNTGDLLGYGDSTGFSTGHHLHFGMRPLEKKEGGDFTQMFKDNGYKGYVDPEPFMPHLVWDLSELTNNIPIIMDNYLVQLVEGTGGFGLIIGEKLIIDETDKIIASFMVRNNGNIKGKTITFKQAQWDAMEHYNLKMEKLN